MYRHTEPGELLTRSDMRSMAVPACGLNLLFAHTASDTNPADETWMVLGHVDQADATAAVLEVRPNLPQVRYFDQRHIRFTAGQGPASFVGRSCPPEDPDGLAITMVVVGGVR